MKTESTTQMPDLSSSNFSKSRGFRYLLDLCFQERLLFAISLLALLGATASNLIFPLVIKAGVDETWGLSLKNEPKPFLGIIVLLFLVQGLFFFFRSYLFGKLGQTITFSLRCKTFRAFIMQSPAHLDQQRVSDLVSRLGNDTLLIQDAISTRLSVLIRYVVQGIVGLCIMGWLSPVLTILTVLVVPVLLGLSLILGRQLKELTRASQAALGEASSIAEETLANLKIVKAFTAEHTVLNRFSQAVLLVKDLGIGRVKVSSVLQSFIPFLLNIALAAFLLVGISFLNSEQLTLGDLTSFVIYASIVAVSVSFVMGGLGDFFQSLAAVERLTEYAVFSEESRDRGCNLSQEQMRKLPLNFQDVFFEYPSRPNVAVLEGVSFTLPAGKTTALVGESGGGKSTIAELLLDFYQPTKGEIRWGNFSFSSLGPREIRKQIAYVPQEPMLFGVSLEENLRLARPEASEKELFEILEVVNLADFVRSLPGGLGSMVGEKGVQLSGGQKQRLALARALLSDPVLLILDEATSALDSTNERIISEALGRYSRDLTVLIISHRLSTIVGADQLLVLDKGRIVETGTHQSLQQKGGLYSQFAAQQGL